MMRFLANVRHLRGAYLHPSFSRVRFSRVSLLTFLLLTTPSLPAKGVYQAPTDFLQEVFNGQVPSPQILWITKDIGDAAQDILGHPLRVMREHYWEQAPRTVWILEEIGKEQPITVGIVINEGRVEQMRVLTYRESRGDEVRQAFFIDQFKGATLQSHDELDRHIDGVSGATLSVRALTKLARLALFLDRHRDAHGPP
jgi:hypothetical protein